MTKAGIVHGDGYQVRYGIKNSCTAQVIELTDEAYSEYLAATQ